MMIQASVTSAGVARNGAVNASLLCANADGAAPLIGSSDAIRRVRERIERVAATDFTILIEGAAGPESHPGYEVFSEATLGDGRGEVAGARDDNTATNARTLSAAAG